MVTTLCNLPLAYNFFSTGKRSRIVESHAT